MKFLLFIAFFSFISIPVFTQQIIIEASISDKCITQPGHLHIEKNHEAINFKIIKIESGSNCYNGKDINTTGFTIKNSKGKVVYNSVSSKKINDLKLFSGIYKVYVDGGHNAYLKLSLEIKQKSF